VGFQQGAGKMSGPKSEQVGKRRGNALSARPFVAGLLAIFLILQSLVALDSPVARSTRGDGDASFIASLLGLTCGAAMHASEDRPTKHERGHTQCCALCSARDFDKTAALPVLGQSSEPFVPLQLSASIERRVADASPQRPIGWGRSWSAQAPPIFS
jgi:hypothetical protein